MMSASANLRQKSMADRFKLAVLIILSTLPVSVFPHPDLILQIESLDVQIKANPTDTELLIKRGDLYRRHENYPAAALDFAAARKASPENSLLDFYEGRLLLDSGEAAAAEAHFRKYLATHPGHSKAWALQGETSIQLGQAGPAATYFEKAISTTPSPSPSLYRLQVLALVSMGGSGWDQASQVIDRGLQHFGFEISLLGLGIDIALASNQPLRATHYLEALPDPLRTLPQWQTRIQTTSCLASADTEASAHCLKQARSMLENQVNLFMAG